MSYEASMMWRKTFVGHYWMLKIIVVGVWCGEKSITNLDWNSNEQKKKEFFSKRISWQGPSPQCLTTASLDRAAWPSCARAWWLPFPYNTNQTKPKAIQQAQEIDNKINLTRAPKSSYVGQAKEGKKELVLSLYSTNLPIMAYKLVKKGLGKGGVRHLCINVFQLNWYVIK